MRNFLFILLLLKFSFAIAQTEKQKIKAEELGLEAIQLMDEGNIDKAVKLLLRAEKLDPDRLDYPYEIAYALYISKLYEESIEWLKPLMNHPDVNELVFQLLGNAYDEIHLPDSALYVYQSGLEKFPHSGRLYLEQGIVEYRRENYDQAIEYWESGVKVQPNFSSNYFRLGKTLTDSNTKIWSIIYGEIFMLLEPATQRTQEMSETLYNVYNNAIEFTSDTSATISLNKQMIIDGEEFMKTKKNPFEMNFEAWLLASAAVGPERTNKDLSIYTFAEIRKSLIENWFINELESNILFDFHKVMLDEGVLDSYNYWLIMMGDAENYKKWFENHDEEFEKFAEFFNSNRPVFDHNNVLKRK